MSRLREHEVVFTAGERAELLACECPSGPVGPREVEGRTLATLVSAGTELAGYRGDWGGSFPLRPGYAAAFEVEKVGADVGDVKPLGARREFAREVGIADVRDSVPVEDPAFAGRVALVVECSGHEGAVLDGCRVVGKGGEVVLVGSPWRRRTDISAHEVFGEVFRRYVVLRSGWEWEVPRHEADFARGSVFGNLAAALRWLAEGRVRVEGLYETVSPREAADVYRRLHEGSFGKLAAVFDWGRAAAARRGTDTCR
jgi:threonine dehydrogenase-like Zn-dependent dehydrogenase